MFSQKISQLAYLLIFTFNGWLPVYADTMDHYMGIVSKIPKMEIKADGQAQAWAKSARNVVLLTCESVAESLAIANDVASKEGRPLFCLPSTVALNGMMLHDLVEQTYRDMSSQEKDKSKMTVSEVALLGLTQSFPCSKILQQPDFRILSEHRANP